MSGSDTFIAIVASITALVTATTALVVALKTKRAVANFTVEPSTPVEDLPSIARKGLSEHAPVPDEAVERIERHTKAFLRLAELIGPDTRRQLALLMDVDQAKGDTPSGLPVDGGVEDSDGSSHTDPPVVPTEAHLTLRDPP